MLLAPTVNSMRKMLACCDTYASDYNVIFNANKSKCIFFPAKGHKRKLNSTLVFEIGSQPVEFVSQWPHLGHIMLLFFIHLCSVRIKTHTACYAFSCLRPLWTTISFFFAHKD